MSQEYSVQVAEELPVTFQVAMIASDGWVLASDRRVTLQGPSVKRTTYETKKIHYENQVASAPYGDESAQIARDRIIEELQPNAAKLLTSGFHREMERFAESVWQNEYESQCDDRPEPNKIRAGRERGVIFLAVGGTVIVVLQIGKQSNVSVITTKYIAGDPANPVVFLTERFYEKTHSVSELAVLATYSVAQARRFNVMISGMQALEWHIGQQDAKWLSAEDYELRSQKLEENMAAVMLAAMKTK
jgi:hypothetical protein